MIGAEALAAQRDSILGGRYPQLQPLLQELIQLRAQMARKTLDGPGPEGVDAHREMLARWGAQKERLETHLTSQIPEMNLERQLRAADRRSVAAALPEASALVEFIRFNVFDFRAIVSRGDSAWRPAHYLAFILHAAKPDDVDLINLGEAEPIDRMVGAFRASITGGDRNLIFVAPPAASQTSDGSDLRTAVFDRLLPALATCTRLFLAPDGDLNRLPFDAMPLDNGRRIIDEYRISYVSVGRDVLRFAANENRPAKEPMVVADPEFDLTPLAHQIKEAAPLGTDLAAQPTSGDVLVLQKMPATVGSQRSEVAHLSRDFDFAAFHFPRLPGTRAEGEEIAALLGVQPHLGASALEAQLKALHSPRVLHIATHGFFLPNQGVDLKKSLLSIGQGPWGRFSPANLENPLLRSGLALAGANTWLQGQPMLEEAEDGLLTAEDVTGLDLLDTDLVVLSACETGLGDVHAGEGVFGLRRAFALAGAKTLVMSLWKVPDQYTKDLMVDFYKRFLIGRGSAEALREAQLMMKARHASPMYWGAFICQGR